LSSNDRVRYELYFMDYPILDTGYRLRDEKLTTQVFSFYRSLNHSLGFVADPPVAGYVGGWSIWARMSMFLGLISFFLIPAPLAVLAGFAALYDWNTKQRTEGMWGILLGLFMGSIGTLCLAWLVWFNR
jgi:hypothetical protein